GCIHDARHRCDMRQRAANKGIDDIKRGNVDQDTLCAGFRQLFRQVILQGYRQLIVQLYLDGDQKELLKLQDGDSFHGSSNASVWPEGQLSDRFSAAPPAALRKGSTW